MFLCGFAVFGPPLRPPLLFTVVVNMKYRKIPIISPGLIFVQKAFSLGLFSGELIFGGACYRKEFCVSKWVSGLSIVKHLKTLR